MKPILKCLLLFVLMAQFACTSTKKIQRALNSNSYSLNYLMDTAIAENKKQINVKIDSSYFNDYDYLDTSSAHRSKALFLPLIVFWSWSSTNICMQGKSMIQEDIPHFFKTSLTDESNRSGIYSVDSLQHADYTIDISIDEISTEGPYYSKGFYFFAIFIYGYTNYDEAGPAISNLKVSYNLKKKNQVVHSNTFSSIEMTKQLNKKYTKKLLQSNYAISMVEATSLNFKNVSELIVEDVNAFLATEL